MKNYDSEKHVKGESQFVDDINPPQGILYGYVFLRISSATSASCPTSRRAGTVDCCDVECRDGSRDVSSGQGDRRDGRWLDRSPTITGVAGSSSAADFESPDTRGCPGDFRLWSREHMALS